MVINIILALYFSYLAFKIFTSVKNESPIYEEFSQSKILMWLSLLYPIGPIINSIFSMTFGWEISAVFTAACYIPGLVIAKKQRSAFECAGTDRARNAQNTTSLAFDTAIGGIIYTILILLVHFLGWSYAT